METDQMTFPEIATEAAKRGLSIHIKPYGAGVGVYVVTAGGHQFARAVHNAEALDLVLKKIPQVFDEAAEAESQGAPQTTWYIGDPRRDLVVSPLRPEPTHG